jgi:hypothetical protein
MSTFNPILPVLHQYYQQADWTEVAAKYAAGNDLNLDEINAHAGVIASLPLKFQTNGLFDFGGDTISIVVEIFADDDESTVDLCGWPVNRPHAFATAIGKGSVMGAVNIANPTSWAFGEYLEVHKTPLEWLKADCRGVCILDYRVAPYDLSQALGPILAQDERHAAELKWLLCKPPVDPKNILYPRNDYSKAA